MPWCAATFDPSPRARCRAWCCGYDVRLYRVLLSTGVITQYKLHTRSNYIRARRIVSGVSTVSFELLRPTFSFCGYADHFFFLATWRSCVRLGLKHHGTLGVRLWLETITRVHVRAETKPPIEADQLRETRYGPVLWTLNPVLVWLPSFYI